MRRPYILILCAALIATLPLILNGCSCGHDFTFHLQSWLDAAQQLRHGTLLPRWAFTPAWNAGEPRFIFYPPLSWMLGAVLTLIFPITAVPAIYTFIAFAAAGLTMHRLASHFAQPKAAVVAAILYVVNPYMLFNAYERTAYAELLAAAWLPLLFLALLRKRPTVAGIALPLALLWLTNAPAAVIGSYTLALIILIRLVTTKAGAPGPDLRTRDSASPLKLALTAIAGAALGLALSAFYVIPAAYERRFVQIAMALVPGMRIQDNFPFIHFGDPSHDGVLHTVSLLAAGLLVLTASALIALYLRTRKTTATEPPSEPWALGPGPSLSLLTATIALLLTPLSRPLWNYLPELAFLQFPWRLLSVLAVVFALALTLALRKPSVAAALVAAVIFTAFGIHNYRQWCDDEDRPAARAQLFNTHHGVEPTDEYTPNQADNDVARANNPAYWLASDPAAFAPKTTPNPLATSPHTADKPEPENTLSAPPPHHLQIHAAQPETLIFNLRDYPNWDVTVHMPGYIDADRPHHLQRDDGLLAIPLAAGDSSIDIRWRPTLDQQLGLAVSAIALCIYLSLIVKRSRRIEV